MINLINNFISTQPNNDTALKNGSSNKPKEQNSIHSNSIDESVQISLSPQAQKYLQDSRVSDDNAKKETALNSKKALTQKNQQLSDVDQKTVQNLQTRDVHVKMHEGQHMAVAGAYAVGGPHYTYTQGPDGKAYAVGGEVQLDTSPIPKNPEATIQKAQVIRQGALAPADPSGADRSVAAAASAMETQARQELAQKNENGGSGKTAVSSQLTPQAKARDQKLQAYRNFMNPKQTGLFFNQSA